MAWLAVISLLTIINETFAVYCGENIFCRSPYKCCETKRGCCYDSISYKSTHIRPQIWNMWYFWLLIIFMMMSCFGGCGYYRRRRLAFFSRISNQMSVRPITSLVATERGCSRSNEDSARQFNFFAYGGSGVNLPETAMNLPPPYAEVISQPKLYPVNRGKLPPYPGDSKPEVFAPLSSSVLPHHEVSLPPPYSECSLYPEYSYNPPHPSLPPVENDMSSQCVPSHQSDLEQPPSVPPRTTDELT